ncbi:MAG: translation initiation factor IF-2, partial [Bacteroidota bacterium]
LVKIAKELNVGTSTIVDFLTDNGHEIENKPTAKITDEMYDALLKEFQKSIDIKEKARQINIGSRNKKEDTPEVAVEVAPPPVVEQTPTVKEETQEDVVTRAEAPRIKLKTLGKIDLGGNLQKRVNKTTDEPEENVTAPVAPKNTTPQKEEASPQAVKAEEEVPQPPQEVIETPTSTKVEAPVATEEKHSGENEIQEDAPINEEDLPEGRDPKDVFRGKTPELRGLKILGKIDTNKFERPKKKKPKETGAPEKRERTNPQRANTGNDGRVRRPRATGGGDRQSPGPNRQQRPGTGTNTPKTNSSSGSGDQPQRKKRKRKKIAVENNAPGSSNQNRGGNRTADRGKARKRSIQKEEVKEVSQKEIEEKIKATMARLQGGGKKRRQKLQRDKRDRLKEKQEAIEAQNETDNKLEVTEFISVSELASIMNVSVTDVITTCMNLGIIVSINQRLDAEVIELVADEFNFEVSFINAEEQLAGEEEEEIVDDPADLLPRNPIVTVMGHVDHGKTSLLDYIRNANVASGEAGGITQHIGAYEVKTESGQGVTFLDTPGHEAFTAMRARGAKVTDIAIIIIAADDNIMPQTREAISHSQAAGVPMVFAINKIDKPGAQPERIKQELASMNFLVEEWGGSYQSQDISAKNGTGIEELLEKVLLEAEILELKANPKRKANGTVVEASLEKGRGYVTKVLVQNGTLHIGDPIVAGEYAGKVRAMMNERGKRIKEAGPSKPVLILGLSGAPQAGEIMKEMETEQEAKALATKRSQISREQANRATKRISLDEIGRRLALGTFKELNLIVKGDVDGSVEALADSLIKLSVETVQVNVIHKAVGQIIESDVLLASASDAIIIGFQVRPSMNARKLAEKEGVQIKTYSIIYETIEEIKLAIEGMLEPTKEEKLLGEVEIRETFKISKVGTVAGCYVKDGKIGKNNHIRLIRDGIVVYPTKEGVHGKLASLKRFKDDVKEVKNGLECGLSIENFNDIKVGDTVESYEIIEIKQTLDYSKR